ncbi:hypothetical protein Tco_0628728 [Tanacetum coccineum]|uniref:Uncharacterized protein n=1 Tax=Tanacetum coccineum TaxID=301880 RepID=A0ABQ4WRW6_9ASTR
MTDALLANVQTTQVIEDTHVIITAVTPEVQQQSSSVSSGFISNMLNPNRNTVLAPIFILNTESTSLLDVPLIKTSLKEQVKEQVSKILPKIKKLVNDQLEAEVLTHSSNEAKTSHAKTLYKALVDAYETDKDIHETYGDTVMLKRRRDDKDEDEDPFAGSNQGWKRRRAGKEPESTSAPKEKTSKSFGKSKEGSKSHQKSTGKSLQSILLIQLDWIQPKDSNIYIDLQRAFTIDSIYEPKAADYGHIKWIEDFVPNSMWSQVPSVYDKHALWGISHWGRKRQQFHGFVVNKESARDVYSKHRILGITKLTIVEWHNYKHLDWITVRRNDDKLYTFKEGDYNRLRLQDIEVMLLLLVQGKLKNLNVVERLTLGVSLRMFTRSIILRRGVEDLQILDGVTLLRQSGRIVDRTEQEAYDPGYYIDKTPEQKVIEEPGKFVVGVIRGRPSIL